MISEGMSTTMKAKKRAMTAVMGEMKAKAATGTVEKTLQPTKLSKKVRAKQNDPFEDAVAPVKAAPKKRVRDAEAPAPKATKAAPKPKKPKVLAVAEPPPADDSESEDDEDDEDDEEAAAAVPTLADDSRGDPSLALDQFELSDDTVGALRARGVDALFPIQAATFKLIFAGKDVIGRARTGMGKTLAFGLPTIERLYQLRASEGASRAPRALVMAPTRELAQQVARELEIVAPKLSLLCVYGGAPMGPQTSALRQGVDLIVGTPGRLKDLNERGYLALEAVRVVTLDEADMMLDMGFADDMKAILGVCNHPERQTCLFSATMPKWVRTEAPKYMLQEPETVDLVGDADVKASTDVRHIAIPSHYSDRPQTINSVIASFTSATGRCIVFCDTKADCDELVNSEHVKLEVVLPPPPLSSQRTSAFISPLTSLLSHRFSHLSSSSLLSPLSSHLPSSPLAPRRARCTATSRSRCARRRWRPSATAASACSSRPTSRRAASTCASSW